MADFSGEGLENHKLRWEEFWYVSEPDVVPDSPAVPVYTDPTYYRRTGRTQPSAVGIEGS
jgi:hypothetical protein